MTMTLRPLADRIALVTGASRGIGQALARELARQGAHVIAVARTQGGLEELDDAIASDGGTATLVPLDLAEPAAIDALGARIYERWGRLDILIGNAGVLGRLTPVAHIEPDMWRAVMAVNVTANLRLIRAMDPLLRQAAAGRALFVTSGAAWKMRPYWGAYAASKAALEAVVKTYAAECVGTAMRINLLEPGSVATRMRAQAMPGEKAASLPRPEDVARCAAALCQDAVSETGAVFNFAQGCLKRRS